MLLLVGGVGFGKMSGFHYTGNEGGLTMIQKELKTIKSFGSQLESIVTMEDIAAKEKKLKIRFPEALKELYLTFHPEDPLFSGSCSLLPFEELKLQRIRRTYWHYALLPFAWDEMEQMTYLVGIEVKASPKNEHCQNVYHYQEEADPPIFYIQNKQIEHLRYGEKPDLLSGFILRWLSSHQVYAMPSILGVKQFSTEVWESLPCLHQSVKNVRISETIPPAFLTVDGFCWRRPDEFAPVTTYNRDTRTVEPLVKHLIGARTDGPLEELLEHTDLEPRWQRSQKGHEIFSYKRPEKPKPFRPEKERKLISIAPVLEFLCKFAGVDGPCATADDLAKAETRLGGTLPLPLQEYYQCMPKVCYRGHNYLMPLGSLRFRKDGKITFLTENQGSCYFAVENGSCYLFQRENEDKSPWEPVGIIDGYLVWEFILDLACYEKLEIEMDSYPDFKLEMLAEDGALYPYLSDIAGITEQIAVGNCVRMYQGMEGRLVAVCENQTPKLYLFAKDTQAIEDFCKLSGDNH